MDVFEKVILFLHLLGMAYLVGGLLIQLTDRKKTINRGIMDGTLAQLITGPILFWIALTSDGEPVNHLAITGKIIFLVVMIIIVLSHRKSKSLSNLAYFSLLALALGSVAFAVVV